jgi:hypothetical protein
VQFFCFARTNAFHSTLKIRKIAPTAVMPTNLARPCNGIEIAGTSPAMTESLTITLKSNLDAKGLSMIGVRYVRNDLDWRDKTPAPESKHDRGGHGEHDALLDRCGDFRSIARRIAHVRPPKTMTYSSKSSG